MTELKICSILIVFCILIVVGGWYMVYRRFVVQIPALSITIGIGLLIWFLILDKPGYWFWIPGILVGGFVIPSIILWLAISWAIEKTVEAEDEYLFPN